MKKTGIAVIDYGSQYTQLIARRIREEGVFSVIYNYASAIEKIKEIEPKGIVLSGGPSSVYEPNAPNLDKSLFNIGVPILGICYGMHLLAHELGGRVFKGEKREYGHCKVKRNAESKILHSLPEEYTVWMSHGDIVEEMSNGWKIIISSDNCPIAGFENEEMKIYALQYHPEVAHSEYGIEVIRNFIYKICKCEKNWSMDQYIKELIYGIKNQTAGKQVMVAVSGGVDSTVLAYLLYKAIGNKMVGVFIDNGLLRKNEGNRAIDRFKKIGIPVNLFDASEIFLNNLKGVIEPERKRRIIGEIFVNVFKNYAKQLKEVEYFAQGTLYPDVVESGASIGPSSVIKTHHNLVEEVKRIGYKILEPFRELFKDEVRNIGKLFSLPDEILLQHPFPGPGLAVRIIGEITKEKLSIIREADEIIIEEIKKADLYNELWQCFPVLLPIRTVGVMGDQRSYNYVIAIRAIKSIDGMTASWAMLPYELLNRISARIVNEVKQINRVVYDITNKPPATIEWE